MSDVNPKEALIDALTEMVSTRMKSGGSTRAKAVSSTPGGVMGHGPGGLFATPGLSKPVFSAMLMPYMGVANMLPVRPTRDTTPLFDIITGQTASTGDNPSGVCDDPKTAGVMKVCTHSFPLGRWSLQTTVADLTQVGKITNRGEFLDLQSYGLTDASIGPFSPTIPQSGSPLAVEAAKRLFEFGVAWSRDYAKLLYTGNTTNNTAGGGYKEFYGFDVLINTGYRDAETGNLCPAADSNIRSFGDAQINSSAANSQKIVREIIYMWRYLNHIASRVGLSPVQIKMSMPWGLFFELTELWPVSYETYAAYVGIVPTGATQFVSADGAIRMRDDMRGDMYARTGQYLLIDGQRVQVILDDSITETQYAGGTFESQIYFIPFTVLGNVPVTYLEYFDQSVNNGPVDFGNMFATPGTYWATDDGRFLWHRKPPTNWCVQLLSLMETRLIMLTPYLAGRITDIRYTPLYHERSWDPSNTSYWKDGGRYTSPLPNPSYSTNPAP